MPIYEYQCENCSRRFEVMQRMTEPLLATCEKCGGHVRRLISQTSFVLKGGGWYVTDYPSESRKKAMSQEKAAVTAKPPRLPHRKHDHWKRSRQRNPKLNGIPS